MVFDGGLAGAGDEEHALHVHAREFFHHVLDDGLASHRQHFLGLGLGRRQEPRAQSGDRDDGDVDIGHIRGKAAKSKAEIAKAESGNADQGTTGPRTTNHGRATGKHSTFNVQLPMTNGGKKPNWRAKDGGWFPVIPRRVRAKLPGPLLPWWDQAGPTVAPAGVCPRSEYGPERSDR